MQGYALYPHNMQGYALYPHGMQGYALYPHPYSKAKIISPEWDSSTSLMSFKRLGQYMAVGSFFMDLAPVFEVQP